MTARTTAFRSIAVALCALLLSVWSSPMEAQRRGARRRAPRLTTVITVDPIDCDMARWPEPQVIPVAPSSACATGALLAACGAPVPASCPAVVDPAALTTCPASRPVLVVLTQLLNLDLHNWSFVSPLVSRFSTNVEDVVDEISRILLMELLWRSSRYRAAVTLAVHLIEEARDPAIQAFARERLIAALEYEDWNEDQILDDDYASHFFPPLLPDRPWALDVARRALARVGCPSGLAVVRPALRARFQHDVEALREPWMEAQGSLDLQSLRERVLSLPLSSCVAERMGAVAMLRVHQDGTVEAAGTQWCITGLLGGMTRITPGAEGADVDARFVFVFANPPP